MSSESDIEMQSALPEKTKKKTPKSPSDELLKKNHDPKKITTKEMITEALTDLNTRKGTSLYAIKKYLSEKYNVNVDKMNHYIKKNIRLGIQDGTLVQTKGVGITGSFKLAPKKKSEADKPKKKVAKKTEKSEKKTAKTKKGENAEKKVKVKKVVEKNTKKVEKKSDDGKKSKAKMAKVKTPAKKKAAMMKRKSIGSIIKPPKMKPKARA